VKAFGGLDAVALFKAGAPWSASAEGDGGRAGGLEIATPPGHQI